MKKIISFFLKITIIVLLNGFINNVFSSYIPVENVFSDIKTNYKYYNELQSLYNKGAITPDKEGKLSPNNLLLRDEFVTISMEVTCKKCRVPNTFLPILQKYANAKPFFDVQKDSEHFYCIARADDENYVKGYEKGDKCDDGTYKLLERPFCPSNHITLEEAIAVILRNSNIFTIEDNNKVTADIKSGKITQKISDDVGPITDGGFPYTFYGYLKKALSYSIEEYDNAGNKKIYKLLELQDGKIHPKNLVSKEDFLRMAYIALKTNSCKETLKDNLAIKVNVFDKECKSYDAKCRISKFDPKETTYDLKGFVGGACEKGISEPDGYIWRFYHKSSGNTFMRYGKYVDDYTFLENGERIVYLRVIDKCSNTGEVYTTMNVKNTLNINIKMYDKECRSYIEVCNESKLDTKEKTFDLKGYVSGTCNKGVSEPSGYIRRFYHMQSGDTFTEYGKYIDNYNFLKLGERKISLKVIDGCGNVGETYKTITRNADHTIIDDPNDPTNHSLSINIIASPVQGHGPLPVSFTGVVNGGIGPYNYKWDFGDDTTGNTKTPIHTYTKPGDYIVKLFVTDKEGNTSSDKITIKVLTGVETCFTDTDGDSIDDCTDNCPDKAGTIETNGCPPTNNYLSIKIIANPIQGHGPLSVSFTGFIISPGVPGYNYYWTFGDETTGNIKTQIHTYTTPGIYNVRLVVTDSVGNSDSDTATIKVLSGVETCLTDTDGDLIVDCNDGCPLEAGTIETGGCPPINNSLSVQIEADPMQGLGPLPVSFTGIVNGGIAPYDYKWTFGDTNESIGKTTSNTYITPGTYTVKLIVTDSQGKIAVSTTNIKVSSGPTICKKGTDTDDDGVDNCDDKCIIDAGELENDGCPIYSQGCKSNCTCDRGMICSITDPKTCGKGICLPPPIIKDSCLYEYGLNNIYGNASCSTCPCPIYLDFNSTIRKCDLIFPAITSPDSKTIYSNGEFFKVK